MVKIIRFLCEKEERFEQDFERKAQSVREREMEKVLERKIFVDKPPHHKPDGEQAPPPFFNA